MGHGCFEQIRDGAEIPSLQVNFSAERNARYCRLVNEINPLHFDLDFARSLGYRDIVVAGIFTASFFPKLLTDWLGERTRVETIRVKFKAPAYLNETVTYRGRVVRKRVEDGVRKLECELWSENAAGERLAMATVLSSVP
ncbi:MAG: MaoC/PaaZ C-terminal domain-containing protein [bacterium]